MDLHKTASYIKKHWRFYLIISFTFVIFITSSMILFRYPSNKIIEDKINSDKKPEKVSDKINTKKSRALPVVGIEAKIKDVPVYLSALGAVTPLDSVTVKTQVNGMLLNIFFHEGQLVKAGDLLAQIDSQTYQAQYTQFEGQLLRDQSYLTNARLDLKRYKLLYPSGGVSRQTLDTQTWLVKQYEGIVQSDIGQLEGVKVNLNYCKIISPISGLVGLRQVNQGNFVQISDTNGIVVINKLQPISVLFSIPEDYLPKIIERMKDTSKLSVRAFNREQTTLLASGELLTTDNQIDPATGTIKLRAQFKNESFNLFPNQFVNIKLLVETLHEVTIVPSSAIQHGIKGDYVFILNNNHTVKFQKVTTGITEGDETVVKEGVRPGELVVVEGADKLTDGAEVST